MPWRVPGCDLLGTGHLIGARHEALLAERALLPPPRPAVADPTRAPDALSVYAYLPHGSRGDVSQRRAQRDDVSTSIRETRFVRSTPGRFGAVIRPGQS